MKAPTDIASNQGSRNLVLFDRTPDVDGLYHKSPTSSKALNNTSRCLLNLDRNIKDNQGGCLYEWPCSQNYDLCSGKQLVRLARKLWIAMLARNGGSIPSTGHHWQKPGIGVRPSVKSSSLMALPRGKDNRVLSLMTPRALVLQAGRTTYQGKGWSYD